MLQIISKGIEKNERYWQCWSCCCGTGPRKQACFLPLRRTWSNQCRQLSIFIISYFNYKKLVLLHMWPSSYSYSQLFNPVLSWHSPCLDLFLGSAKLHLNEEAGRPGWPPAGPAPSPETSNLNNLPATNSKFNIITICWSCNVAM